MDYHRSRHPPPPAGKQPLPRLVRCKSENRDTSPLSTTSSNISNIVTKSRSTSTTRTRNYKEKEVIHPRKKPTSPSAWALSPGRVAPYPSPVPTIPPSPGGRTNSERGTGGISGVLKYFSKKKTVAASEEVDRHCFKLMNNRLLQWRFANARAETAMSTVKTLAEKKAFNAWLKILAIRNSNMAKRMEVQKLENDIKLYQILNSQIFLLEKWSRMEAKNFEAVGRVVRKLSVASLNVPLIHDSKGDVLVIRDEMNTATTLMEKMESTVTKLSDQAEKSCYMLTELSIIAKQEKECLAELQTWMSMVASLKEKERSLQAHLIQAN